mmetsp:Transcript_80987/g.94411  ORF Transcript_80987/g.94411 Transcript_80987/m.94411 type:complete len:87 (-) Transcript_80987:419-679(-)
MWSLNCGGDTKNPVFRNEEVGSQSALIEVLSKGRCFLSEEKGGSPPPRNDAGVYAPLAVTRRIPKARRSPENSLRRYDGSLTESSL